MKLTNAPHTYPQVPFFTTHTRTRISRKDREQPGNMTENVDATNDPSTAAQAVWDANISPIHSCKAHSQTAWDSHVGADSNGEEWSQHRNKGERVWWQIWGALERARSANTAEEKGHLETMAGVLFQRAADDRDIDTCHLVRRVYEAAGRVASEHSDTGVAAAVHVSKWMRQQEGNTAVVSPSWASVIDAERDAAITRYFQETYCRSVRVDDGDACVVM